MDSFPKNQWFVFGQRLADHTIDLLELLVEAACSADKVSLLTVANWRIEMLRWLVRLAKDRKLFTPKQYEFGCLVVDRGWSSGVVRWLRPVTP